MTLTTLVATALAITGRRPTGEVTIDEQKALIMQDSLRTRESQLLMKLHATLQDTAASDEAHVHPDAQHDVPATQALSAAHKRSDDFQQRPIPH